MPPPRFDFPMTIEALHIETGAVVWSLTIPTPENATLIGIPPLREQLGHPVAIRVRYADGTEQTESPIDAADPGVTH